MASMVGCGLVSTDTPEDTSDSADATTADTTETVPFNEPVSLPTTGAEKTLKLNSSTIGIHVLGKRVLANRNYLNCDYSGSGIEFTVDMQGGDLTVLTRADGACNFLVWVDGNPYQATAESIYLTLNGDGELVIKGIPYGKHTVRIVKVTGYEQAQAKFFSITLHGSLLTSDAPVEKDIYVEFLGGDAASGLGVLGNGSDTYTGQDATKAYPYLLAEQLDTEYNVLALSDSQLMQSMSEAFLYASIKKDSKTEYDFEKQADVTVIHISADNQDAEAFRTSYRQLVKAVKAKNGENSRIVCVYNQAETVTKNAVTAVCEELGGAEKGYFSIGVSQKDKGVLTAQEQQSLAQALTAVLQEAINTELIPGDDPIQPDDPDQPDQPINPAPPENLDVPGEGNDLQLGEGDVEIKIDNNDPAWKA